MRIIVAGAGEVGSYVAELLSKEGHDVIVVEQHAGRLAAIEQRLDVYAICGSATDPGTLAKAGLDKADMIAAVTSNDEVNLIACLLAKQAGVDRRLARIQAPGLRGRAASELHAAMGADQVIDPDDATAKEILGLLTFAGSTEFAELGGGEVLMIGAVLTADAPFVGQSLSEIAARYEPEWDFIVSTITRGPDTIIPRKDHRLEAGDAIRVLCKRRARRDVMQLLGLEPRTHRRVMLLGGGRTGELLAGSLASRGGSVTLIERTAERAHELAESLDGVLVLHGDITDTQLLDSEQVGDFDAVVALTGQDDANILACLYAKLAGVTEAIAVLHRLELRGLLQEAGVDVSLSPRTASANEVLRSVQGVAQVATSLSSDVEVLEVEVAEGSRADGATVSDLGLPHESLVAAIVRDGKPQIGRRWSELRDRDHVIVVSRPQTVEQIRDLFTAA